VEEVGATTTDLMDEALALIEGARRRDVPLRLVGGAAVRFLTPGFPPRTRAAQDLDLASVSRARPKLTEFLRELGYEPDTRFNALYGHKQLYFTSPAGRAVDVLVDRLEMCHAVEFAERIERMPVTLDVTDLLLSKLQIVQLNEKDVQDAVYLLAAFPVRPGDAPGTIGLDRVGSVVAGDWGWWRTLTGNVDRIGDLVVRSDGGLVPKPAAYDVAEQLQRLRRHADEVPKTRRWKMRSRIGERKRWYRVPEEEAHD
jgi:hypothetical protein